MPKPLASVLRDLLEQYGIAHRVKEFEIINLWPEVVGEKVASMTHARDIRDGRLYVEVANSVWRNELYFMKAEIIEKINKQLGQKVLHDIVFV